MHARRFPALAAFAVVAAVIAVLRFAPGPLGGVDLVRATLRLRPVDNDAALRIHGFFEDLASVGRLTEPYAWHGRPPSYKRCTNHRTDRPGGVIQLLDDDWRAFRLMPEFSGVCYIDTPVRTNRFGFRGPEWSEKPAPGVIRIAIMGASYVMGSAVREEQTFPVVLEHLLNDGQTATRYEVLNLGILGYSAVDELGLVPDVLALSPQVVVVFGQDAGVKHTSDRLEPKSKTNQSALDDQHAARLPAELRLFYEQTRHDPAAIPQAGLGLTLASWKLTFERLRVGGAIPIMAMSPSLGIGTSGESRMRGSLDAMEQQMAVARAANVSVIDLRDLWEDRDQIEYWVNDWDPHPNPSGHRIIAARLAEGLRPLLESATRGTTR